MRRIHEEPARACDHAEVTVTSEARKRLWGRSGNRCAICQAELVRRDESGLPGALIGEEAHIIARSPGGPRYERLEPAVRDGYDNLILLCANDHTQIDAQPSRYTTQYLRTLKHRHELWVQARLRTTGEDDGPTLMTLMRSADDVWPLLSHAYGWSLGMPEQLTQEHEDLIDEALQTIADWCDISDDVEAQGLRAVRQAKRSITAELESLAQAGFLVLGGQRQAAFGGGTLVGPIFVLQVVRPDELDQLRITGAATELEDSAG
jgi:hypothetical protein